MSKNITRIVLTGGPAAGKTTVLSRILKEFRREDGWRVITIPETATELISGFGLKPFDNCMSMYKFQYFVISDQLHKEELALKGAEVVPEDNILIIYDRAIFDDKAYVSDDEFAEILSSFGKTEDEILSGYDAVIHLVSSAKGAEFAYNLDNAARSESLEDAVKMDDLTLRAWSRHPVRYIIENYDDFEVKITNAIAAINRVVGRPVKAPEKKKYLIKMPDCKVLLEKYSAVPVQMMQTYLTSSDESVERRIRQQSNGSEYLYFYTDKHTMPDGSKYITERPISLKEYVSRLMEYDYSYHSVKKCKYNFIYKEHRLAVDVYPFCDDKAVLYVYEKGGEIPEGIEVIKDITNDEMYKNRRFAAVQEL